MNSVLDYTYIIGNANDIEKLCGKKCDTLIIRDVKSLYKFLTSIDYSKYSLNHYSAINRYSPPKCRRYGFLVGEICRGDYPIRGYKIMYIETKFPVQNKISIEKYHAANVNGKLHSIEFAFPVRSLKVFIIIYSHGLCVHFTVEDSRDMIREKIDIYKIHTDCHEQSKNLIENELKHMD